MYTIFTRVRELCYLNPVSHAVFCARLPTPPPSDKVENNLETLRVDNNEDCSGEHFVAMTVFSFFYKYDNFKPASALLVNINMYIHLDKMNPSKLIVNLGANKNKRRQFGCLLRLSTNTFKLFKPL